MKALQGKKILITRNATQAGSLKEQLVQLGAEVICIPTIKIIGPPDWQQFDQAAKARDKFDWVVFTSVNAVIQTQKRLTELSVNIESDLKLKIASIGDQTAKAILNSGWKVDLVPDKFQAEDLGEKLIESGVENNEVWLPRALKARNILVEKLEKARAVVSVTPVYENKIPLENRERLLASLTEEDIDWITFTSSSTVTHFFKIAGGGLHGKPLPMLASIGKITTRTLEELSYQPVFTANPQNLTGLCQGIVNWESTRNDG